MKTELLASSPLTTLPIAALFFFLTLFLGLCIVALRRERASLGKLAELPLHDGCPSVEDTCHGK